MKSSTARLIRTLSVLLLLLSPPTAGIWSAPALAQAPPLGGGGFTKVWNTSVPPLRTIAVSPLGVKLALLTDDGKIAVWQMVDGKPIWSVTGQTVNHIAVSDGVGYVMAYRALDPIDRSVLLFNADTGKKVLDRRADGAIWDLAVSESGDYAALTTGAGSLDIFTLDVYPTHHRVALRGIGDSLDFANDETYMAIGLWNGSGVGVYDTSGNRQWYIVGKATRRYDISVAKGSGYILATDYYNHNHDHPILTLWRRDGKPVWTYDLGADASDVTARSNSTGTVTVASFKRTVNRGSNLAVEWRMIAIDRAGQTLWRSEYGGPYLSPRFICFTPGEDGIVFWDSDRRLYRMTLNHYQTDMWQLSAPIRSYATTDDNRYLVANTVDDRLTLLALK